MALGFLAKILRIACPALHVEKSQGGALSTESQCAVQMKTLRTAYPGSNGPGSLGGRMGCVIQTGRVLHGQDDRFLGKARFSRLIVRLQERVHPGVVVVQESIRRLGRSEERRVG